MTQKTPSTRGPVSEPILRTQDEGGSVTLAAVRERAADKDDPCVEFVEYWLPNWESKCSSSEGV
jgi:hypothetical protein